MLFLGATLTLLATMPTANRVIRFIGALYAYITFFVVVIYGTLGPLALTNIYCGAWDEDEVCDLVATGLLAVVPTLPLFFFQFLRPPRRGPDPGRSVEPGGAGPRRDERKNCEKRTKAKNLCTNY